MKVYFFLFGISLASCLTLPIKDNSYPDLVINDHVRVSWTSGFAVEMFLTCKFIRFSRFGIRCIPHKKESITGGRFLPCSETSTALCNQTSMRYDFNLFFPTTEVRVRGTKGEECQEGQNRVLNDIYNDLSLCDLGENVDVIYDPPGDSIYWSEYRRTVPVLEIIASVLIIVMTILACESLVQQDTKLRDNTFICFVSFACAILMLLNVDGRKFIALTWEDDAFYLFSVLYILFGIFAWTVVIFEKSARLFPSSQRYGINISIANVQLLSSIMLAGPDNPYSSAFFLVYLFRFLCKIREWEYKRQASSDPISVEWSLFSNLVLLADLLFCAATFQLCVRNQFYSTSDVHLYTIGLYSIAETASYLYLKET
jgi:hypothetical protein